MFVGLKLSLRGDWGDMIYWRRGPKYPTGPDFHRESCNFSIVMPEPSFNSASKTPLPPPPPFSPLSFPLRSSASNRCCRLICLIGGGSIGRKRLAGHFLSALKRSRFYQGPQSSDGAKQPAVQLRIGRRLIPPQSVGPSNDWGQNPHWLHWPATSDTRAAVSSTWLKDAIGGWAGFVPEGQRTTNSPLRSA